MSEFGTEVRYTAEWVRHAIFWHVYPLGFVDAEKENSFKQPVRHRLGRITGWMDYAVKLGASALMLGPIFAASTHGYDTIDHFKIDPRLGDDSDFDALIRAARERGLCVVLDGVFNHVGRAFPVFQKGIRGGQQQERTSWFRPSWPNGPDQEPEYATFEGHHQLVALNHAEPAVINYVVRVMNHWLDRGAGGWRLDAALPCRGVSGPTYCRKCAPSTREYGSWAR